MNTRKLRKLILTLCSALLLVSMSVGITVAYLTSEDSVTNTFTVGQVKITLDEAKVDENGDLVYKADSEELEDRVHENNYKLYPNGTYAKDPIIWIDDEDCDLAYLRVVVTFENATEAVRALNLPMEEIFISETPTVAYDGREVGFGWNSNALGENGDQPTWTRTEAISGNNVIYTLTFNDYIDRATTDIELFDTMKIPNNLSNDDIAKLNGVKLKVEAYAVQADGFENADDAFATAFPELWGTVAQ